MDPVVIIIVEEIQAQALRTLESQVAEVVIVVEGEGEIAEVVVVEEEAAEEETERF
jgi:hypothetical protein